MSRSGNGNQLEDTTIHSIPSNRITKDELKQFFLPRALDNRIMVTVCDKGYLNVFRLFYRVNKMDQYKNFVVVVLDKQGYKVIVLLLCQA